MQTEQVETHLLDVESTLIRASTGKRFANYIIDVLLFYAIVVGVGIAIVLFSPVTADSLGDSSPITVMDRIIGLVLYAVFMSLVEGLFKGKSLGKLITGTRAVNLDGSKISFRKAFARGFSRAVPFSAFTAFGTPCDPIQDSWTHTMVIDEKQSHII